MTPPKRVTLLTHRYPEETAEPLGRLLEALTEHGIEVLVPAAEVEKHRLGERPGVVLGAGLHERTDLVVVLGGDGTILGGLRAFAGRRVPVFAFNFGAIGFLATVDHDDERQGLERVLAGEYDVLPMPALTARLDGERRIAVNDISFQRRPDERVAELAYCVGGEQLARVRCDGVVASTPVGSTGYNLANGGPVLAWGVEGFVVSFIAPHTLTARALVVATDAQLTVTNVSAREGVDVTTDGRMVCALEPGESTDVAFAHDQVLLAQVPGSSFYSRLRDKFGRLAS